MRHHKPSARRHKGIDSPEINITPVMNLMIVLVPFLLLAAVFTKTAILNLYLPSIEDPSAESSGAAPEEVSITVAVTKNGFKIGGLTGSSIPDIPMTDGKYDYTKLSLQLKDIKEKYKTSDNIVLLVEPDVDYNSIIHTMDATREAKDNGKKISLFPNVSLADSIIVTE